MDFDDLLLIGFDKTNLEDQNHLARMVHFFLYDYRFERVWKNPDNDIEKLSRYRAVLSPDFSIYLEMAPVMQVYNVFRNRWCGAYWASKGIRVIPSVNWGDESTFDFCFEGIEKGSVVAVSTYMASESDHHKDQKKRFMAGYQEMLRRIEPERIICYNTPFPEMEGNIVYVDYERSSWRYMNYERSFEKEALAAFKIGGTDCAECDTIAPFLIGGTRKGGGSAYGGEAKPAKPADERFWGTPGEIKTYFKSDGTKYETKIGPDGRAIRERHHTEHYPNGKHSNPHDHIINWETPRYGQVNFGPAINYWAGEIPEFKNYGLKGDCMKTVIYDTSTPEENKFKTIRDFKDCIIRGGEVVVRWKNEQLFIFKDSDGFCLVGTNVNGNIHRNTIDEVLEYVIGDDRLRDVITQVTVLDRTI